MALISCPECSKEVSDQSKTCIHCGFPIEKSLMVKGGLLSGNPAYAKGNLGGEKPFATDSYSASEAHIASERFSDRKRGTYIILGLFLGGFGIHNYYAGYYGTAVCQGVTAMTSIFFPILSLFLFGWITYELFTVKKDGNSRNFLS